MTPMWQKLIFMQAKMHQQEEVERRLGEHDAEFFVRNRNGYADKQQQGIFAFNNSGTTVCFENCPQNYEL